MKCLQTGVQTDRLPEPHEEREGEQQRPQRDAVTQVVDDDGHLIMNFTLPLKEGEKEGRSIRSGL